MSELTRLTACAAVDLRRRRKVSPLEMIDAAVSRIEATDGQVNALPTLWIERAREHAQRLMGAGAAAQTEVPLLAGLPIAVKDLKDVAVWKMILKAIKELLDKAPPGDQSAIH